MSDYHFVDILVNSVLAIIMLGVGLSLTIQDFRNILVYPRAIISGLTIQILIIPAIAYFIGEISNMSSEQKVGMVLVSTCASGASSNLITHLVRGNVALAISMTTLNSMLTLITLPVIVNLALLLYMGVDAEITLPVGETILQIFIVTIAPASLGVLIRKLNTKFAVGMEKPLKYILPLILAFVFILKIMGSKEQGGSGLTMDNTLSIFPYVLALNVLAMTVGYFLAKLVRLPFRDQFTIAIEVGLHNTALALLVAGTILKSPDMEKPALVYAMFTFFSAFGFIWAVKGKNMFR